MDLADASLVALAETRRLRRIFTLDTDFYIYRLNDREPLEVFPLPGSSMHIAAGARLGRYEIRSHLGAGGMGELYLAAPPSKY